MHNGDLMSIVWTKSRVDVFHMSMAETVFVLDANKKNTKRSVARIFHICLFFLLRHNIWKKITKVYSELFLPWKGRAALTRKSYRYIHATMTVEGMYKCHI